MSDPTKPRTPQEEIVHKARVELVRKYLEEPRPWPDGIDWGSHWYRNHKAYWDALVTGVVTGVVTDPEVVTQEEIEVVTQREEKARRDRAEYMRKYRSKKGTQESS